jgi:membrane protein
VVVWQVIQFPVAALGLVALAFVALYFLPNVAQRARQVLFASTLTAVLWIAATLLFRLYIRFLPPNQAYGLVGAAIVLLTWMYYTMFIVLVCGELASEIRNGTGAVAGARSA